MTRKLMTGGNGRGRKEKVGMVLPGIVTNITNFGAFVDVGVKQDGLVHISQMADRFISDPNEIVSLHQHVKVKVTEVDKGQQKLNSNGEVILQWMEKYGLIMLSDDRNCDGEYLYMEQRGAGN